ncbi:MAG: ABC transporter ATP-binding protein [Bacillota bacterium]|uniref:ABC transporter ATP-binding protein n=1 Tax=Virgibacillus salarius TaxID=447199 RepID=A0A941IBD6_9BACI|nr:MULTISPECIES: ABC transporter ATP-binding protein [Bacillaceae]NAZ09030.1 ATP-binding cassette domain-containing protein [Agaribacter marinus]MBR7796321.1 ABC transporter ATP-binding protein [Virgibacillus salarius]MCC2251582.1 ABC transporter ATP-binding protein [Virgibacillus sp. AGTR]MDY7044803.1 ABC transporter ATP-binding protein [Virgibacillus sp. M23]QRZ16281.1 ABC transporter ATP-binding protein [Virgibacillus sp. AGTR]
MKKIVELSNVIKEYGKSSNSFRALKEVSFDINEGEFVGIMGPSGSGKTTLLNIMSTIDKPTYGKVLLDGKDLNEFKGENLAGFRRDNIGFVFQSFNLLDNMTVRDNIALPLTLNNVRHEIILQKIDTFTKLLGISDQMDKYPVELSGGQKQRVAICRALITDPKVIFADEPTGALDSKYSSDVLECFKNVNSRLGITIIMVTHDSNAASYCDRVMFLKDGKMHGRLDSNGNKQEMFTKVLDMLAILGGSDNELL